MSKPLRNFHEPSRRVSLSGSVIVLLLAVLLVIVVMAFGLIDFSSSHRIAARDAHQSSLLRATLHAGSAHAQAVIEQAYETAGANGVTELSQEWRTVFGQDTTSGVWPTKTSHPDVPRNPSDPLDNPAKARIDARVALADSAGSYAKKNAIDLWRNVFGMASPPAPVQGSFHGFDEGYVVHDGIGRWFTVCGYDRSMTQIAKGDENKAAFILRYAVAVEDLSARFLANRAMYSHLLSSGGTPIQPRLMTSSINTALTSESGVLTSGAPCDLTDRPIGPSTPYVDQADAMAADAVRYNTWRPIPADHRFLAYGLFAWGMGLDQSVPETYADGYTTVGSSEPKSLGDVLPDNGVPESVVVVKRTAGNLSPTFRAQGFYSVTVNYLPLSDRYADYYPAERNPFAPGGSLLAPDQTNWGKNQEGKGLYYPATASQTVQQGGYPTNYKYGKNGSRVMNGRSDITDNIPQGYRTTRKIGKDDIVVPRSSTVANELIRNRHIANLIGLWNTVGDDKNEMYKSLIFQQFEMTNWGAVSQSMRIHSDYTMTPNNFSSSGGERDRRLPSLADGKVQLMSPFGTPIGQFDAFRNRINLNDSTGLTLVGANKTSSSLTENANLTKNQWEMRTQWAVNINTASQKSFETMLRLVISDVGGDVKLRTIDNQDGDDPNAPTVYDTTITKLAQRMLILRSSGAGGYGPLGIGDIHWNQSTEKWSGKSIVGEWLGGSPASVSFSDSNQQSRIVRGLRSLIHGGPTGRGPCIEFAVASGGFDKATRSIKLKGRHLTRFRNVNQASGMDPAQAENAEYRVWLATGSGVASSSSVKDLRGLPAVSAGSPGAGDRRLYAPFKVQAGSATAASYDLASDTTTIQIVPYVTNVNDPSQREWSEGYADLKDWEHVADNWQPEETIAYIDYATSRWRDLPDTPWPTGEAGAADSRETCWVNQGPGLSLTTGRSRHFRFVVRAQLYDVDRPELTRERTWDRVIMIDPDRSGAGTGTKMRDAVFLYNDLGN